MLWLEVYFHRNVNEVLIMPKEVFAQLMKYYNTPKPYFEYSEALRYTRCMWNLQKCCHMIF